MVKTMKFDEYSILELFYRKMIDEGSTRNLVHLDLNSKMVEYIYDKTTISITENELQKQADICIANDWIKHTTIGTGSQYRNLILTTTGFGVIKSKLISTKLKNNRNPLKKVSDYIEYHKGFFILLLPRQLQRIPSSH